MQLSDLDKVLDQISRDKNINKDILIDTMEQAILSAAKRVFGNHRQMEARYNPESGNVELFLIITIVDDSDNLEPGVACTLENAKKHGIEADIGDEILFQIYYHPNDEAKAKEQEQQYDEILQLTSSRKTFGRIAAQTAKQVIVQRVREAERETIYQEFKDRVGDIINGVVRRFEKGNIIIDIGRTEAILPQKEQVASEFYRPGERITAYLKHVKNDPKGPQITLSRREEGLVRRLFEIEVPEIYQGIVVIEAIAREPGSRTKIAVSSKDRDVDPVGACVGMKGLRVQNIKQQLRNEKIDIVPFDSEPARFVCNAIAPSHVSKVIVDATAHTMELIIPDEQLSLAIGKRGQNVRLASQLTGWKIDIYSESKVMELEQRVIQDIASVEGVGQDMAETMFKLGWRSLEDISQANPEELARIPGLGGMDAAINISTNARILLEQQNLFNNVVSEEERILEISGVDEEIMNLLISVGFETVESLYESSPEEISQKTGLPQKHAEIIHQGVAIQLGYEEEHQDLTDIMSDNYIDDDDL